MKIKNKISMILVATFLGLSIKAQGACLYDFSFQNLDDQGEICLSRYKDQFCDFANGLKICKDFIVKLIVDYKNLGDKELGQEREILALEILRDYLTFLNKPAEEAEIHNLKDLKRILGNVYDELSNIFDGCCSLKPEFDPIKFYENMEAKVVMIVNVASKCQLSNQLFGLQLLAKTYENQGLVIIAVPSFSFGALEYEDHKELTEFYRSFNNNNFIVTRPVVTNGEESHPLYKWAREKGQLGFHAYPGWNFHKYLFSKDGKLVASFQSLTKPGDPVIEHWIKKELEKS